MKNQLTLVWGEEERAPAARVFPLPPSADDGQLASNLTTTALPPSPFSRRRSEIEERKNENLS